MNDGKVREVVVIGAGPAGYTAAIYLGRARFKPLLLTGSKAGGQLMLTTRVENFPGFKEGIMGPDLMEEMRIQAEKFEAEIKMQEVTRVDLRSKVKKVWTGEKEYRARTVIVATGAEARMLNKGEEKFLGKGVSTCAVCDAAFFKEKTVFVVGGGDTAMEDALALTRFVKSATVIHRRNELRASKIMQERVLGNNKIRILWDTEVVGVGGESKLEKIKIRNVKDGKEEDLMAEGLFLAIGHAPVSEFLKGQVDLDEKGYLITNLVRDGVENKRVWLGGFPTQTSVEGVFGAGDVVDARYKQAVTAAGMGCMAALDAGKFLTESVVA